MKRHAYVPSTLAPLEERIALSHIGLIGADTSHHHHHTKVTPPAQTLNLYGLVGGTDSTHGSKHQLKASGATLSPLTGSVSLSGDLVIPITGGTDHPADGTIRLADRKGTVTVDLSGTVTPLQFSSFTAYSGNLTYKIISGTKAYKGATGTGTVSFGPGPAVVAGKFLLDFGGYPPPP